MKPRNEQTFETFKVDAIVTAERTEDGILISTPDGFAFELLTSESFILVGKKKQKQVKQIRVDAIACHLQPGDLAKHLEEELISKTPIGETLVPALKKAEELRVTQLQEKIERRKEKLLDSDKVPETEKWRLLAEIAELLDQIDGEENVQDAIRIRAQRREAIETKITEEEAKLAELEPSEELQIAGVKHKLGGLYRLLQGNEQKIDTYEKEGSEVLRAREHDLKASLAKLTAIARSNEANTLDWHEWQGEVTQILDSLIQVCELRGLPKRVQAYQADRARLPQIVADRKKELDKKSKKSETKKKRSKSPLTDTGKIRMDPNEDTGSLPMPETFQGTIDDVKTVWQKVTSLAQGDQVLELHRLLDELREKLPPEERDALERRLKRDLKTLLDLGDKAKTIEYLKSLLKDLGIDLNDGESKPKLSGTGQTILTKQQLRGKKEQNSPGETPPEQSPPK